MKKQFPTILDFDSVKVAEAQHHNPFSVLGRHPKVNKMHVRLYLPYAESVNFTHNNVAISRIEGTDFFEYVAKKGELPPHYRISWLDKEGGCHEGYDPYDFGVQLPEFDLHLFGEGKHWHIYQKLGAHLHTADGISGVLFAVWAPNAGRVSVIGDFNRWDGRCHPMRSLGGGGVWELFIPELDAGCFYKFEILNRASGEVLVKADPYGQQFENRPKTAAMVVGKNTYNWQDSKWLKARTEFDWLHQPM